ncbi:MAG: hypothetical protein ABSB60_12360 [Terracidiphilus sp.]
MNYFKDLFGRLSQSRRWVAAQFIGTPLLILVGIAWTRLPEKHLWQVALTLLVPVLVAISILELNAGTMRSLAGSDGKRVKLVWGAMTLLVWIAVVWISWMILDWCDDQTTQWASYLNSQAPAHWRARLFTYEHLSHWITILVWIFRWIVVPAKVLPYAMASAQTGYRLPLRRVLQLLWNWRWWPAVAVAALLSVWLPSLFFAADPHGAVSAQIWHVSLKLAATYLLAMISWVLLLAWAAVLFGRQQPVPKNDAVTDLFKRLRDSHSWVGAQFSWILIFVFTILMVSRIPSVPKWRVWILVPLFFMLLVAGLVVEAGMLRSLLKNGGKRIKMFWGVFSTFLWAVLALTVAYSLSLWHTSIAPWVVGWVVAPAILLPFAAASTVWGLRLPWRRILRLIAEWRWWLGLIAAMLTGVALPCLINAAMQSESTTPSLWVSPALWVMGLRAGGTVLLVMGSWVLLLGWLAVLLDRQRLPSNETPTGVPALVGPPEPDKQGSVKAPLPESD